MRGLFELNISMGEPGMTCAENLACALEDAANKLRAMAGVLAGEANVTAAIFAGGCHVGHWAVEIEPDDATNAEDH